MQSVRKSKVAPKRKSVRKSKVTPKRKSVRKSKVAPKRKSVRKSKVAPKRKSRNKKSCKESLRDKISINMKEYKNGRYLSPKQAIAVSYSQVKKMRPKCSRFL